MVVSESAAPARQSQAVPVPQSRLCAQGGAGWPAEGLPSRFLQRIGQARRDTITASRAPKVNAVLPPCRKCRIVVRVAFAIVAMPSNPHIA